MDMMTHGFSEEEHQLFSQCRYPYILTKADLFLHVGPERYRSQDYFGMPDAHWEAEDLEDLAEGCRQVMEGKGFSKENPFVNLGVHGFNMLFALFHFKPCARETFALDDERFLDKMIMKHVVDGGEVTYYNLSVYKFDGPQ